MARLNEPPAPTESLDALKRRFIRQNREIARCNSTQSLRIRNLESEITRLLAENMALREQAINLKHELEKQDANAKVSDDVLQLKSELEDKLSEVNSLVSRLSDVAKPPKKSQSRKSLLGEAARSPEQREWRNTQSLAQVLAAQEGRLPTIMEHKAFPRRTLSGDGLNTVIGMNTALSDSPDLGPPPVAHFDVPDPIKFDKSPPRTHVEERDDSDAMVMVDLSSNLERRRKRRASALLEDMALEERSKEELTENADLGETDTSNSEAEFNSRRRSAVTKRLSSRTGQENRLLESKMKSNKEADGPINIIEEVPRRPLGAKSANSPSKPRRPAMTDKISVLKDEVDKTTQSKDRNRDRKLLPTAVPNLSLDLNTGDDLEQKVVVQPEMQPQSNSRQPKTPAPAPMDLFSPMSNEAPSTGRPSVPPTPEMAFTTASLEEIVSNASGRTARRARAQVSYAEPNLRDKMRRPTKELVDAVITDKSRSSISKRESSVELQEEGSMPPLRTVTIKKEKPDHPSSNWKNLPTASEEEVAASAELAQEPGSPLTGKSNRAKAGRVASSSNTPSDQHDSISKTASAMAKLSMFDGPSSSPHPSSTATEDGPDMIHSASTSSSSTQPTTSEPAPISRKPSRRHSTAIFTSSNPSSSRPPSAASSTRTTREPRASSAAASSSSRAGGLTTTARKRAFDEANSSTTSTTTTSHGSSGPGIRSSNHHHSSLSNGSSSRTSSSSGDSSSAAAAVSGSRRRSMMV